MVFYVNWCHNIKLSKLKGLHPPSTPTSSPFISSPRALIHSNKNYIIANNISLCILFNPLPPPFFFLTLCRHLVRPRIWSCFLCKDYSETAEWIWVHHVYTHWLDLLLAVHVWTRVYSGGPKYTGLQKHGKCDWLLANINKMASQDSPQFSSSA